MATPTYTQLEPSTQIGNNTNGQVNIGGSFVDVATSLEVLLFGAIFVAGMLRLGFAGSLLTLADNPNKLADAKKIINRVVLGVGGVLFMWLLLLSINPTMLRGEIGLKPIPQSTSSAGAPPIVGSSETPILDTSRLVGDSLANAIIHNEFVNKTVLSQLNGVVVSSTGGGTICDRQGQTSCTSVGGLDQSAIDMLNKLVVDCGVNCPVVVTGGTEWWLHSSGTLHRPDNAVVDLNCTHNGNHCGSDYLSNFIRDTTKTSKIDPPRNGCQEEYVYDEFSFCDEVIPGNPPHWHVQPYGMFLSSQKNHN